jgi:Transglycosylase-like domain
MAYSSLASLVQSYETGGSADPYTATNPNSTASGAYQFTNPTWQQYAGQAGYSQYSTAASAPPAVQDAVFQQAVSQRGLSDWTCPGCNSGLSSYVASNDVSGLPVFTEGYGSNGTGTGSEGDFYIDPNGNTASPNTGAGSSASGNPGSGSSTSNTGTAVSGAVGADVGWLPPADTGGPETTGLSPGAANTIAGVGTSIASGIGGAITGVGTTLTTITGGWLQDIENWVGRGFLILLAAIVIMVALWRIMDPSGAKVMSVARAAT